MYIFRKPRVESGGEGDVVLKAVATGREAKWPFCRDMDGIRRCIRENLADFPRREKGQPNFGIGRAG